MAGPKEYWYMMYCKYCYRILEDDTKICPSCKKSQLVEKKQLKVLMGMFPIYNEQYKNEANECFRKTEASYSYALEAATVSDFLERWKSFAHNASVLRTYEGIVPNATFCRFPAILSKDSDADFQRCLQNTISRAKQNAIRVLREKSISNAESEIISFYEDLENAIDCGSLETSQVSLSAMYEVAEVAGIDLSPHSAAKHSQEEDPSLFQQNIPDEKEILHKTNESSKEEMATQNYTYHTSVLVNPTLAQPSAMEFRHNQLDHFAKYGGIEAELLSIDLMDGHAFEHWCADILRDMGYENITVTPASGDHGVDILAEKDGLLYAIQCKRYSSDLGNTPVQEVHAGKYIYHCHVATVITNQHFTSGAKKLAAATGVLLWDRDWILRYLKSKVDSDGTLVLNRTTQQPNIPSHSLYKDFDDSAVDSYFVLAVDAILETGHASVSMLQRRLRCGYTLAARLVDKMEDEGLVGPFCGSTPRIILITKEQWQLLRPKYE